MDKILYHLISIACFDDFEERNVLRYNQNLYFLFTTSLLPSSNSFSTNCPGICYNYIWLENNPIISHRDEEDIYGTGPDFDECIDEFHLDNMTTSFTYMQI